VIVNDANGVRARFDLCMFAVRKCSLITFPVAGQFSLAAAEHHWW
jgi:hypothetical protein